MNNYRIELLHQLEVLDHEQRRIKEVLNMNSFDVTTAPYVIMKEYRTKMKAHIVLLRNALKDLEECSR